MEWRKFELLFYVMNIAHWLKRTANCFPAHTALVGSGIATNYAAFAGHAAGIAHALTRNLGVQPGDRVAVLSANNAEYLEALYGIWWAGAIAVPINAKLHAREAAFILNDAGCRAVFASAVWREALAEISGETPANLSVIEFGSVAYRTMRSGPQAALVAREPDDIAWLFYTSGTTGKPKGAMLTHRNLMAMTFNYFTDVDSIDSSDCILHAAPVSHGSGLYNFAHVLRGAAQIFPDSGGFDPDETLALLKIHRGTSMFAAPTMVKRLAEYLDTQSGDTQNLKTIIYGGGPMYVADLKFAMQVFGNRLVQIYGQGESPMTITALSRVHHRDHVHPRYADRIASVGVAHSGIQLRVCDENGREVSTGEPGEICVKGDTVMRGYWNNPLATSETLRDGWLWTGDLGSLDVDGFLTLKDRSKDLIISGGSNIYPREIEEVLLQFPGVAEVSVVGRTDAEWGEVVIAFVVVQSGAKVERDALDCHCLAHIARFKRPKEYRFVDALPKNNYGKILKTELRKLL